MNEILAGVLLFLITAALAGIGRLIVKHRLLPRLRYRLLRRNPLGANKEKTVIYLSSGGTCRDPIAKAVTTELLRERAPDLRVRVEGLALHDKSGPSASWGAQQAIIKLYGKDLLADHVPRRVEDRELEDADLVFVMDQHLLRSRKTWPKSKPYLFREFFGLRGDVDDPFREFDRRDAKTLARYLGTAREIKSVLEDGFDLLVRALRG